MQSWIAQCMAWVITSWPYLSLDTMLPVQSGTRLLTPDDVIFDAMTTDKGQSSAQKTVRSTAGTLTVNASPRISWKPMQRRRVQNVQRSASTLCNLNYVVFHVYRRCGILKNALCRPIVQSVVCTMHRFYILYVLYMSGQYVFYRHLNIGLYIKIAR